MSTYGQRRRPVFSNLRVEKQTDDVNPAFNVPREIGMFSIDSDKNVHFDRSQMKYYIPVAESDLPLDLNAGYEETVQKEFDRVERMEQLLKWIIHCDPNIVDGKSSVAVDFVTMRSTLQKILCTPYCTKDSWTICATKLKGTIYFMEVDNESSIIVKTLESERAKLMCSWGYKFEQYMTASKPDGVPDMSSNTQEVEEFAVVVTNRLKNHSLLYKGKVDAVDHEKSLKLGAGETSHYIDMRTTKMFPEFSTNPMFLKSKSLRWWSQCYVAGIERIVCGLRDDDGFVRSLETINTSDLSSNSSDFWKPNVCFNFCDKFLIYLKNKVVEDNYRIVYRFDYRRGSASCQKLERPGSYQIIPEWFATELKRCR